MRECRHPWGIYIQADEVLHERSAEELAAAIQRHDGDPRIEGLLVRYLHFYGGFDTVATHRRWYRRQLKVPTTGRSAEQQEEAEERAPHGRRC